MKAVAIIPARGGSRRIKNKNRRTFHGKPIIAYSIETAKASGLFDEVWVSTEDWDIGMLAQSYGAMFYPRPAQYAKDEVGTQEVMREFLWQMMHLKQWRPRYACCIYPTAPMLSELTLRQAAALLEATECGYVVPVATWLRDPGQFYFGDVRAFIRGIPLISNSTRLMEIDPATECDINIEADWQRAEQMYADLQRRREDERARAILGV